MVIKKLRVLGSIVLYMYTSEKTDRVIWQFTDTTGVPILGRVQAKHMNYISYPEISAPPKPQQSTVSKDSLQSTDYNHIIQPTVYSPQTEKTPQSLDSLKSASRLDKTVQDKQKSTLCLPLKSTFSMNRLMFSKQLEL